MRVPPEAPAGRRAWTPSRYARHRPPAPAASGRSSRTGSRRGPRLDAGARRAGRRAGAARRRTPTANPAREPRGCSGPAPEGCPGSGPRPGAEAGCSSSGGRIGRRCRRAAPCPYEGSPVRCPSGVAAWRRSPRRWSSVSAADRWHPLPGTAPRPARRPPVARSCRRPRHRVTGDPTCPDRRTAVRRCPRTPASRTRRTSPDPALPGLVGSAHRTPASRCPHSSARPARRSPAGPAPRLPGAPTPRNPARPRPQPAAGPVSAGSSGVEESRRGVLRCSCTPVSSCPGRSVVRGPSSESPAGKTAVRARIPARKGRHPGAAATGAYSPACVRVTLRVVPGRTGTSPPGRRHLPGTSPYPAVILSGSLRS